MPYTEMDILYAHARERKRSSPLVKGLMQQLNNLSNIETSKFLNLPSKITKKERFFTNPYEDQFDFSFFWLMDQFDCGIKLVRVI